MTNRPLCIYHGNCVDGFGAAWVVRKFFKGEVDFHPGFYGAAPPDVTRRDVIMVDFSYKRTTLDQMAVDASTIVILDHHKTAAEDLASFAPIIDGPYNPFAMLDYQRECNAPISVHVLFDMERSGVGLAWDYFFPNLVRPNLLDYIQDRDLWQFRLPLTRSIHGCLTSHPYDFEQWDWLIRRADNPLAQQDMAIEGEAIHRKLMKDIGELLQVTTRRMVIGGISVPVANLPSVMASEAGNIMAVGEPFAGTYYDSAEGRLFSLRSGGKAGADVSAVAKLYGGGGHRNAAGFKMPIGWEGDR